MSQDVSTHVMTRRGNMAVERKILKEVSGEYQDATREKTPPVTLVRPKADLIPPEVFQNKIEALRGLSTIRDDKGDNVDFDGQAKEDFLSAFEEGYPILERTLSGLYELGSFLHAVRTKLRPHKLYHAWLDYAGIPRGTAQSYLQAYERYGGRLPRFAALGIRKLLIASRLPDCAEYVEQHEQEIASQTTEELEQQVKALRQRKESRRKKAGRKPRYLPVGSYRIRPSMDGTKITIEGMTKKTQDELIEVVKRWLSRDKGHGHDGRD